MNEYAPPLGRLIEELKRIPGIGSKSAQRMAFHLLAGNQDDAERLADAIRDLKKNLLSCSICNNITQADPCSYCTDPNRGDECLCVVEEPFHIAAIEKSGVFHGRYYVLLGALAPLKGIGPESLRLEKLEQRLKNGRFKEIIIATNPTSEGEATAHFLVRALQGYNIKFTRLAMGLPVGSDIDFADQVTVRKALEGRTDLSD
ncbi:MAG: recombination mediator RecR [Acidobacteriota bacterium]|jgi:DNA replication and repair protein RecR|nr:recombination protein RecR [Acidobacteriota bacterium]OQB57247.1 MAG: Recombination protein RecR [Candidatus Aminicenantes bacterium ADurb.Bin147]HNQ81329.1 recombination mediator RecR [Candidatus Aminicenantes bacterium]MDD8010711.1 recombination mediator RecR [Acidobacteriota bacterium]MDD8030109.1 recombination mediator RecR [Acidobacteriota bacterium]